MASANVAIKEKDLTTRVKSFDGIYNAIIIPAKKGEVLKPRLVSDEADLLKYFTPDETVKVGYDLSYFSALAVLQRSNKLWVIRTANNALYGGAHVYKSGSTVPFNQINEVSPELKGLTFKINQIEVGSPTINVSDIYDDTGAGRTADALVGRVITIEGALGTYTVSEVTSPDATISDVTLDRAIETSLPTLTGTGTGSVSAEAGVSFSITSADTTTPDATVLSVFDVTDGALTDIAVNEDIYVTDGTTWKAFTVSAVDDANSTITIDATGEETFIASATSGKKGFPAQTFDVLNASENASTVNVANVVGDINWLVNRIANVDFNLSDGSTFAQTFEITTVDGIASTITFDAPIDYTANNFITPISGTSAYAQAVADGFTDPTAVMFENDEVFYLTQSDEGEWGKDLRVEIITDPEIVKEPDAFKINVYKKDNLNIPVESFIASRIAGKKDGYGKNIYIDDVLKGSNFIRGYNNPAVPEDVMPEEVTDKKYLIHFVAGDDGLPVTESNMIEAADLLANKNNYPMTLFLDGGYASVGFQKKIAEICEIRKDSMAILSVPFGVEDSNDYLNAIVDYRKNQLNLNTSYAALFTSHVKITDKYNDREIFVSPDGYAAAAINFSYANYEIWYPPAGFKRGNLYVNDTAIRFKDGDMDYLYDNGINPIRFYPGKGIAIWGQKTLSARPSVLDRMNVRLLLMVIQPAIANMLEDYLFELNDDFVGTLMEVKISSYLEGIKARKGVYDFKVISNDTNNLDTDKENYIRNVDVYIKPTLDIEYINFTTILTPTSLTFDEAQLAV